MKKIISLIFTCAILVSLSANTFAQCGKSLFRDVTIYRCETDYTPIDLVTESGLGLSLNGGFWVQIVPGTLDVTPGTGEVGCIPIEKYATVIGDIANGEVDLGNVYNQGESNIGTYEFIYVVTHSQGCGVMADDMVRVKLRVLSDPQNIKSDACPDLTVDLYSIIQPYYQELNINSSTVVDFAVVGNGSDDNLDASKGEYFTGGRNGQTVEIQFTVIRPEVSCNINNLILKIADRDGLDTLAKTDTVNLCRFAISDPLDLYTVSGIDSALYSTSGNWKQTSGPVMFGSHNTVTPSGVIDTSGAAFADTYWSSGLYIFEFSGYNTNPCDNITGTETAEVVLRVTDNLLPFAVDTTHSLECNNSTLIELDSYLPVSLPSGAGSWLDSVYYFDGTTLTGYKDINESLGADVVIGNLFYASLPVVRPGSYYFKYRVSGINDKLCGLAKKEFVAAIELAQASNLVSQSLEICSQNIDKSLNLFSLLNEPVEQQDSVWSFNDTKLSAEEASSFVPSEHGFRNNQTYVLDYLDDAVSCGTSSASLYVTVKESILIGDTVEMYYCYSNGAEIINISNLAGFVGVSGNWTWKADPSSYTISAENVVKADGSIHSGASTGGAIYLKGRNQYLSNNSAANGQISYIFTFEPTAGADNCLTGADKAVVKVIIGDTMTP
ncbi:MAG: hypothetical protein ACK5MG_03790 [Bacteroidales bacterium]